jgi:hypothetical protein
VPHGSPASRSQVRPLTRAFVARFFDNEITTGTSDLRSSFFWLIALLAPPGVFMPILMGMNYQVMVIQGGSALLRHLSWADKVFYLGLGMVATGAISVIVWNALLVDRRDALVLGALPVGPATVVRSKLLALSAYVGLLMAGMHAGASIAFGVILGNWNSAAFMARNIVAHFVASCAAGTFVLLSVAALQGVFLSLLGPRRFARVSPILQLGLAGAVLIGFLALPAISLAIVDTIDGSVTGHPWILWTPPVWFLGLYETLLGNAHPIMPGLAGTAVVCLFTAMGLTFLVYPLSYRRLMTGAVESVSDAARAGWTAAAARWVSRWIGRNLTTRAAAHFMLTTIGRVERHRFVMAIAGGAIAAAILPTAAAWLPLLRQPPAQPRVDLLALPLWIVLALLIGLRTAAALPADVRGAWLFAVLEPGRRAARAGVWRLMCLASAGVVMAFAPVLWHLWGASLAVTHSLLSLSFCALLTEGLLWGFDGMPCARPWKPEGANLRAWWPAYLGGVALITHGVPRLSILLQPRPGTLPLVLAGLAAVTTGLRLAGRRGSTPGEYDDDELPNVQVLNLD